MSKSILIIVRCPDEHLNSFSSCNDSFLFILACMRSLPNALSVFREEGQNPSVQNCFPELYLKLIQGLNSLSLTIQGYIFQSYRRFTTKFPLFVTIVQQGNAVPGNTKKEFYTKKTVNLEDIHLILNF